VADDFDELQRSVSNGDGDDLDRMVSRYLPRLHAYVRVHMGQGLRRREASLDVVQSVCREVLEERERFEFRGEGAFLSWLLTAAMNKLRQRARFFGRQRREQNRESPLSEGLLDGGASPSREVMAKEEIDRLEAALTELPDDYREVVVLARIVGMPHADIAEHLGRTLSSVRSVLARALIKLGVAMKDGTTEDTKDPTDQ